jgi:hypothetical protein
MPQPGNCDLPEALTGTAALWHWPRLTEQGTQAEVHCHSTRQLDTHWEHIDIYIYIHGTVPIIAGLAIYHRR